MGLYTIVAAGWEPDSPAKWHADKSYTISTDDTGRLAEMAKEEGVSGVFNAFDDFNTWQAQALCEQLGLRYYATSIIEEYRTGNFQGSASNDLQYPVNGKPVGSYASQGIAVCHSAKQ
ncbi:hypothetical protein QWY15_12600 [Planococcus sp. N064]|uniref:NmrA-like domain-containing protein n=1 Tax=Planococcus liqunii TaxID=3058394 RepID=A0ABT8MTB7_9BACL|nr:hypothetical protein [Planococcus sp. N064]MDN7228139.1 hypothetical protein [Planococcus sp. N064]